MRVRVFEERKKIMEHETLSYWERWSVGLCEVCDKTRDLIDGLCYECHNHPVFIVVPEVTMKCAD